MKYQKTISVLPGTGWLLLFLLIAPAAKLRSQMAVNLNKESLIKSLKQMPADTNKVLTYRVS